MKHFRHLVLWDVRRLRALLAVWLLVVVANRVVLGTGPLIAADPSLQESVAVVDSLLWLTMLMLAFALVSFVVHGDPTVGSDAFWMTRPIPPLSLLASKLFLLGLTLIVAPAIADAVLLFAHNTPLPIGVGVIAQSASVRILLTVLLIVGASLTRNLPRFAVLCGATLLTLATSISIFIAIEMATIDDPPPSFSSGRAEDGLSDLVVFSTLLVIAALATLALQYNTRSRRHSVAVGMAGVAAAVILASIWPLPFLAPRLIIPSWAQQPTSLVLSVDPVTISTNTAHTFFPDRRAQWSTVNGSVNVTGVALGWAADVAVREASLQLATGAALRSAGTSRSTLLATGGGLSQPYAAVRDLLDVRRVGHVPPPQSDPPPESLPALFVIPQRELSQHAPARGRYRGSIDVAMTQFVIDGLLPAAGRDSSERRLPPCYRPHYAGESRGRDCRPRVACELYMGPPPLDVLHVFPSQRRSARSGRRERLRASWRLLVAAAAADWGL